MTATLTESAAIAAEQATVTRGQAVREYVRNAMWHRKVIADALYGLTDALQVYSDILNDVTEPATAFYELADHPEPLAAALAKAAEDVGDCTAELIRVFPACAPEADSGAVTGAAEGGEGA